MTSLSLPSRVRLPDQIIQAQPGSFHDHFNQSPFEFSHNLTGHPLFELPRLIRLATTIAQIGKHMGEPFKVTALSSHVPAHVKWSDMKLNQQVEQVIAHIDSSGSLITIKNANLDPDYNQLMKQILAELEELTAIPLSQEITWAEAYIFISSPKSVTPYHIDHESNFLFQIQGKKDVHLSAQNDRSILTEQEIEQYFVGNMQAATYRQEHQDQANIFHLVPGKAVHHPPLAPHWVQNGSSYSVSLSINFCMCSLDSMARVYQVNYFLRKLGLRPVPPENSAFKDRIKSSAISLFANRLPSTKREVTFSGLDRLKLPFRLIRQLGK